MKRTAKDKKILYFYSVRMSFVTKDVELLKRNYPLTEYKMNLKKKWAIPFEFIRQFIFLLREICSSKAVICFFSGYHSILPAVFGKLFKRPVIIFLGGSDAFSYPSFNYGHFNKFLIGKFTCMSARLADLLVPVDDCLIYSRSDYYEEASAVQGIRHFCKNLKTPHQTVRLEYDPELFRCREEKRKNTFITAAFGIEGTSFVRKGIDLVIDVARTLPDCEFTVLGCSKDVIRVETPHNVSFLPPVPYEQLPGIYSRHQFYLQLSIAEGFPSAVCEAMLCECVPVGSDVAAIPFIIGEAGFILKKRDVGMLNALLSENMKRKDLHELGLKARQRIVDNFYPGSRSAKLYEILENLTRKPIQ